MAAALGTVIGGLFGGGAIATVAGQLLVGVALTALSSALQKKPKAPGITVESTTAGDATPISIPMGIVATNANLAAPIMRADARWRTYVLDVADVPIQGFRRAWVDGDLQDFARAELGVEDLDQGTAQPTTPTGGWAWSAAHGWGPVEGEYSRNGEQRLAFRFYNGFQGAADPILIADHGAEDDRPWQSDMIGSGVGYAVVKAYVGGTKEKVLRGDPRIRFEIRGFGGIVDPRDSSTGFTENPALMVRQIIAGINLIGGGTFGGSASADALTSATWAAAANVCDETVSGQPRYRAAYDIRVATGLPDVPGDTPADAIEQLLLACDGRIAEVAGRYLITCGEGANPVVAITDQDILVSREESFEEASDRGIVTGVAATYPEPDDQWEPRKAPLRVDASLEASYPRRIESLVLDAVPYADQVQRHQAYYLKDAQRRRVHAVALPPSFAGLEPMDRIAWTSATHSYTAKRFDVVEVGIDPDTLAVLVTLREVDPADHDFAPEDLIPVAEIVADRADARVLSLTNVTILPYEVPSETAGRSRPGLLAQWDASADIDAVEYLVRRAGTTTIHAAGVWSGQAAQAGIGPILGLAPDTAYEVQLEPVSTQQPTVATGWIPARTPDTRVNAPDLAATLIDQIVADAIGNVEDLKAEVIAAVDVDLDELSASVSRRVLTLEGETRLTLDDRLDDVLAAYRRRGEERGALALIRADLHDVQETGRSATARVAEEVAAARTEAQTLVRRESIARVSEQSAIAQDVVQLTARLGTDEAELQAVATAQQLLETRVDSVEGTTTAQAQSITALEAEVQDPTTGLLARATSLETDIVRVESGPDGTIALAGRVDDLRVDVDADSARITTVEATKVDAAGAIAAVDQEISAEFGSLSAMAQATTFANATATDIASGFLFRTRAGGATGELEVVSVSDPSGASSQITLAADRIRLNGDVIINGSLTRVGIAAEAITKHGTVGAGTVANNSATWTTVCTVDLDGDAGGAVVNVIGASFLTAAPSSYPAGFELRLTIGGVTVLTYTKGTLDLLGGSRVLPAIIGYRANVTADPITVALQIRNAGGNGVFDTQMQARATFR